MLQVHISVVIINEIKPKQKATMIDPNLAVQALFRCRGKIINAIFINVVNDNNIETLEQIDIQKKFNTEHYKFLSRFNSKSNLNNDLVTTENHVNRSKLNAKTLNEIKTGTKGNVMGVTLDKKTFLDYLTKLNISIGTEIEVLETISFDQSLSIKIENKKQHISNDVAKHLLIKTK